MIETQTHQYRSTQRRTAARRQLQRARWGRALAEHLRTESVEKQAETARAAREAGLTVSEIALAAGVSSPRVYQLLREDSNDE